LPDAESWSIKAIAVTVPQNAIELKLGILASGAKVLVDSVSIPDYQQRVLIPREGPAILSPLALANLLAFAKLSGTVRQHHPSDQAMETDWNQFVITGVKKLDYAATTVKAYVGKAPAVDKSR